MRRRERERGGRRKRELLHEENECLRSLLFAPSSLATNMTPGLTIGAATPAAARLLRALFRGERGDVWASDRGDDDDDDGRSAAMMMMTTLRSEARSRGNSCAGCDRGTHYRCSRSEDGDALEEREREREKGRKRAPWKGKGELERSRERKTSEHRGRVESVVFVEIRQRRRRVEAFAALLSLSLNPDHLSLSFSFSEFPRTRS
jgi:hypothetical protein